MFVTLKQLQTLFPRAPQAGLTAFAAQAPDLFPRFGLTGGAHRIPYFLAQIAHESAGLTCTEERLSYSAERLMAVWPGRFPTLAAARACAGQPEKLAALVYAGRMGNGPVESGDGWRYRGRGYLQITGRANYQALCAPTGIDLIADPDRAAAPDGALAVACAFWQGHGLNALSDKGDFAAVTRRINGGVIGLEDRRNWLAKVERVLG
ncbi:glycoside hydrolase family 19 protein [Sphingomonas quercus]|uniref:Glycoside hydrolase family 19 protein n=1 Tax=Sphingomonas quercus TaxID=2842451 RepID=A0ABS6BJL4_9SPHN|nr:glycoside hydrolase family 19 protein [Sphingomonas quercus]MBU3078496.1 glycoside hydrolase family 19 protein [Sphingomonas quercus]